MRNKFIGALLLMICTASLAMAEWLDDFQATYYADGIDDAVTAALEVGKNPSEIIDAGLGLEGLSSVELIRALYCAGIEGSEINQAVVSLKIASLDLVTGYKKSVNECFGRIVDSESYDPSAPVSFTRGEEPIIPDGGNGGSGGGGGGRPASPSKF